MHTLFAPGLFASAQVRTALAVGGVVAVVSAVVGVLTVVRGQSFAGHALTESAATGGAGMYLAGVNPLVGFVAGAVAGAASMQAVGVRNLRGRDLATGIVLGASIGLAALFLYLDTTVVAATGATQQILFGSIFATAPGTVVLVAGFGAGAVLIVAVVARPLLLSSLDPDIAAARGVPVRLVAAAHMLALALAVGLSSVAVGAILSTALLVGPAAAALRITARLGRAVAIASAVGVGSTWAGVVLSYDSATWFAGGNGIPVSSLIVGVVIVAYLATGTAVRLVPRR